MLLVFYIYIERREQLVFSISILRFFLSSDAMLERLENLEKKKIEGVPYGLCPGRQE